jgi:glycosyltransferase involved in cell wall biosynthesis
MGADVTVLIPSYNPGRYLLEALDSVFKQTYKNWHIIVIDDASTDNSITLAKHYIHDPKVTLLRNTRNIGQVKSLNRGLVLVETPYTVQLDSDDWFFPDSLQVLVSAAEELPLNVALISGNIKLVIEDPSAKVIREEIWKNRSFKERYDFLLADCSQWPRFYRTHALKSFGGWPTYGPYEGRYMEDRRILYRLIEDYEFKWINHDLYIHRRHAKNQTNLIQIYNEMTEWVVCDALKRWGDQYDPVFREDSSGRKRIIGLKSKT